MIRKLRDFMLEVAGWTLGMGLLIAVLVCCWGCTCASWVGKVVGRVVGYGDKR